MSNISQIADNVAGYDKTSKSGDSKKTSQTKSYGQTIGKPELSDKASKYYEELKKKYSNMNFILVSEDQKENAKANAASFANASNMVVLIDEDKIERMAEDENYRKQYEGIIANAASGLNKLSSSLLIGIDISAIICIYQHFLFIELGHKVKVAKNIKAAIIRQVSQSAIVMSGIGNPIPAEILFNILPCTLGSPVHKQQLTLVAHNMDRANQIIIAFGRKRRVVVFFQATENFDLVCVFDL